jgi:TM2 domain-containing membrane protein YozV
MAIYTALGVFVIVTVIGFGVYWLITNLTFKQQPNPYTYKKDVNGNEVVQDNTEESKDGKDA